MDFHVPEVNHGLLEDVLDRFCVLLEKRAITGIDKTRLDRWIASFRTYEEHYLAACMLNRLIYRSQAIIDSSIDHLLNCLLPTYLRKIDHFPQLDIENFLEVLQLDDTDFPIRIVGVDGSRAFDAGKSGGVIIRQYKRYAAIPRFLTCRSDALSELSRVVRRLVSVDDMLGTVTQFDKLAKEHALPEKERVHIVYCPLIAHAGGLKAPKDACPWLIVLPVEVFDHRHNFFSELKDHPDIWEICEPKIKPQLMH
jgi:hypothetical protein